MEDVADDEVPTVSRVIEGIPNAGGTQVNHWAPQDALGWSCVTCRASWTRGDVTEPWRAAGGVLPPQPKPKPLPRPVIPERVVVDLEIELVDPTPPPDVYYPPMCRECRTTRIRLDKDGRVMSHEDAKIGGPCRGRGYMPIRRGA
jgi:hypothetical protein